MQSICGRIATIAFSGINASLEAVRQKSSRNNQRRKKIQHWKGIGRLARYRKKIISAMSRIRSGTQSSTISDWHIEADAESARMIPAL